MLQTVTPNSGKLQCEAPSGITSGRHSGGRWGASPIHLVWTREYSALGEQMAVPLCLGSGSAQGISYVCMGDSGHDWSS